MTTRQQALRIAEAVEPTVRNRMSADPKVGLTSIGVNVVAVPALTSERGAGGMCDGLSFREHNTVMYAPTDSRRENFTLLHEYAHILVENDDEALIWLADRDKPDVELERLCEDLAAPILTPATLLDAVTGTGPVTGQGLLDLSNQSSASQMACAIALSGRLNANGAVIIVDRATRSVAFAALAGELTVFPWKEQQLPQGHPLDRITSDTPISTKSFWATPWGDRQDFYLNAVATEKRVYAVLADADLWGIEVFHANPRSEPLKVRPQATIRCRCGFVGTATGWPCQECLRQFCLACKECDCDRRAASEIQCERCFCNAPAVDIERGLCSNCR